MRNMLRNRKRKKNKDSKNNMKDIKTKLMYRMTCTNITIYSSYRVWDQRAAFSKKTLKCLRSSLRS